MDFSKQIKSSHYLKQHNNLILGNRYPGCNSMSMTAIIAPICLLLFFSLLFDYSIMGCCQECYIALLGPKPKYLVLFTVLIPEHCIYRLSFNL